MFLTDVAGVFDRAPRLPGATLIQRINVLPDGTVSDVAVVSALYQFGPCDMKSFLFLIPSNSPNYLVFFTQTDMVAATETAAHDVTGGIEAKVQVYACYDRSTCYY